MLLLAGMHPDAVKATPLPVARRMAQALLMRPEIREFLLPAEKPIRLDAGTQLAALQDDVDLEAWGMTQEE